MKRLYASLVPLVVVIAAVVSGCGGSSNDNSSSSTASSASSKENVNLTQGSNLTFAMVTHSDGSSWWTGFKKGSQDAAKALGVKMIWSPANNDPQKEAQLIGAAVSQKVDGIGVTAPNPDAIKGALKKAEAAGIPVITINSGVDQFKALGAITHVGQDETIAGKAAGERFKADGVKKVLCIVHEQGNIALEQRCAGVKEGFGGTVTNVQVKGLTDTSTTTTEIKTKLQADKSFDQVMTLNPDVAELAKTAIKAAGSSAKLATFDTSPAILKDVQAGSIEWAIDQQPYLQGYLPLVFLKLYKTNLNTVGGGQPVLTGPGFIDKSNAAQVQKLAAQGTR